MRFMEVRRKPDLEEWRNGDGDTIAPAISERRYYEKKGLQLKSCKPFDCTVVPGPGFEPGTLGFSVRCSTD